ncbi:MAG: hypothetical protein WKF43_15670 [Acidimicrobiales bacterium]
MSLKERLGRRWRELSATAPETAFTQGLWADVRAAHPRFSAAVIADARVAARHRGERHEFRSRADGALQVLRLAVVTDAFFAQCCYRAKAHCQARGIPVLPQLLHRLAMATGQICIGDPVVVQPGVYIPHGQVVIGGVTEVGRDVVLDPFVTLGLRAGRIRGPSIGRSATIGTGARVIGRVRVGEHARVEANAVVIADVPDGVTVAGIPARVLS